MILSDRMIRAAIDAGDILIEPFDPKALGCNSYDVTLNSMLKTYVRVEDPDWRLHWCCSGCGSMFVDWNSFALHSYDCRAAPISVDVNIHNPSRIREHENTPVLDCRREPTVQKHIIGPEGFVLRPGILYLGVTNEYTETRRHVPYVDGKSSIGRLGITVHCTAGRGDVGFNNPWTLEIHVVEPVRIYADIPIGQLTYHETGDVDVRYDQKPQAKYKTRCMEPQPSQMWRNFLPPTPEEAPPSLDPSLLSEDFALGPLHADEWHEMLKKHGSGT